MVQAGRRERVPYLGGRNFIESIVYTLTYLGYQYRLEHRRDNLGFLVSELERQLCGLARAVPQIKIIYHEYVIETLREAYKDYPLPELGPACPVRDLLLQWFEQNKYKLFKNSLEIVSPDAVRMRIQSIVDNILHQAIMGALYKSGVISHA